MEGVAESPVSLSFFDVDEATEGPTFQRVTLIEADGRRSVQIGRLPVYVYEADDKGAEAVCIAMLSSTNVADDVAIASAFGCHRNTVGRLKRRLANGGVAALLPARPGPKGPHKVTPEVIDLIRSQSDQLNVPTLVRLVRSGQE